MDQAWLDVVDHLRSVSSDGDGVAAHEDFKPSLPAAVGYAQIETRAPDTLHSLVIHKGLYEQIDAAFLHDFIARAKPTFANDVFIVMRTEGTALKRRHPHLVPLRDIARWAAREAEPWKDGDRAAQEPSVPADVALDWMVRFIVENLVKPIDPTQPDSPIAIAETAERFNDTAWFWVDDSGKAAELFAVPSVRDAYPQIADALLDHVLRLSADRIIQRRLAVAELQLKDPNPEAFRAYNCFFNLTGNLKAGIVCPSIRFNDDRTRVLAQYSGNVLRFRYRGRRQAVDVERAIAEWHIEERTDRILFCHTSRIMARPTIGAVRHVCDLTYRYSLWKAKPAIELEAEIAALPGVTLEEVQLSTAFDQFSAIDRFDAVTVGLRGQCQRHGLPPEPIATLHAGPADYLGIWESRVIPGFAHGFHVRLRNGDKLGDVIAEGSRPGQFHWIYIRYALGRIGPGQTQKIVEDRLLTGGGYYAEPDIYCRVMDEPASAHFSTDPSMSYDIGAELNAVAATLLFARQGRYRSAPSAARLAQMKAWFDRHLEIYLHVVRPDEPGSAAPAFVRGLSFVILALDCMVRAFGPGEYAERLEQCLELLLRLEFPVEGGRGETIFSVAQPPELDCHGAALLALARAAVHSEQRERIAAAVRRAIEGTLILEGSADQYGQPGITFRSLAIRSRSDHSLQDAGFWTFKLALMLRAFNAIGQVHAAGLLPLDSNSVARMKELNDVARTQFLSAVRRDGEAIEVLTSAYSSETNSETQPWAALGLVSAVEWELYGRPADTSIQLGSSAQSPIAQRCATFDRMARPMQVEWEVSDAILEQLMARIAKTWSDLGNSKPHWSVLTGNEYLPENITRTEEQFFASGQVDSDWLVATLERAGRRACDFPTLLEYGCGLGRVSNHLARAFERVLARDISDPHLTRAREHSVKSGLENIDYGHVSAPHFGMAEPFSLWFSFIVLQHSPPPIMASVLRRALKLLQPGGLAVFQIPTWARGYRFEIDAYMNTQPPAGSFELHCLPQPVVFGLATEARCRVVEVFEDQSVGHPDWLSNVVVLAK
jgi:SAM-dependent methyltransferase